jgi:hypothetical protein
MCVEGLPEHCPDWPGDSRMRSRRGSVARTTLAIVMVVLILLLAIPSFR